MTELDKEHYNRRSEMLDLSTTESFSVVKTTTAYLPNCSLQNADMHGHELFMAMDEKS